MLSKFPTLSFSNLIIPKAACFNLCQGNTMYLAAKNGDGTSFASHVPSCLRRSLVPPRRGLTHQWWCRLLGRRILGWNVVLPPVQIRVCMNVLLETVWNNGFVATQLCKNLLVKEMLPQMFPEKIFGFSPWVMESLPKHWNSGQNMGSKRDFLGCEIFKIEFFREVKIISEWGDYTERSLCGEYNWALAHAFKISWCHHS